MTPKSLGFQSVSVHFGMFDYTVIVIVGPFENVEKYVRWKYEDPTGSELNLSGRSRGLCFLRRGWVPIIWLPHRPKSPADLGTLAHEAMHAVRFMLVDHVEMPLTRDTDEAFCHAIGHLVAKTLEGLDAATLLAARPRK